MSPFLANLVVGAILVLVGWAVGFGIYVLKQDRAREREIAKLRETLAGLEARFVTQEVWREFHHSFETWKSTVLDKINGVALQLAAFTGNSPKQ